MAGKDKTVRSIGRTSSWFATLKVFCDLAHGCGPCTAPLAEVPNDDSVVGDGAGHNSKVSTILNYVLSFHM
jgi:hypothetical protein